jgi:hypothetical protein
VSARENRTSAILEGFRTWAELAADAGEDGLDWLLSGYLAAGHVTLISGKPKAGKSTLATAIAEAVDDPETVVFLDRVVGDGPVIYVSEEGPGTLQPKLNDSSRSVALTRDGVWPKPPWIDLIQAAAFKAMDIQARLLVIDSLSFWASFGEGQEKDAGAVQATMDALTTAAGTGLAVLLVHHQRKSGGGEGDAVRGSGALLAAVDMSIELERVDESSTQRRLVAIGRWPTTPVLVVDRDSQTEDWRTVGRATSREEAATQSARGRLLATIPTEGAGVTEGELEGLLGGPRNVAKPLRVALADGLVTRSGSGRRGSPYRYCVAPPKSSSNGGGESHSVFSSTPLGGGERDTQSVVSPSGLEEERKNGRPA